MTSKICKDCGILKLLNEFYKRKQTKDGYWGNCKICVIKRVKERYYSSEGREKIRQYEYERVRRPERIKKHNIYNKKWVKKNWRQVLEKNYLYKKKCRELEIGEFSRESKDKYNAYVKNKYYNNINYRLAVSLRNRTYIAVKKGQKTGSAVSDLGCSIKELRNYLEEKFSEGMNWNNWGEKGWHIDHIAPLSSFDLSNREEYLKAVNYKNLQPLWAKDNWKKGASVPTI